MIKKSVNLITGIISLVFLLVSSAAADVSVYAEGAYTDTDLVVYVYADASGSPLVSYGVKLTYDTDQVGSPSVVKDNNVWFFGGPGADALATPNAEPDVSTPGEVVIVGGKIRESAPTEGVSGTRQRIAVVTFNRVDPATPPAIGLELSGRGASYANFVQVDGTVLDGESSPAFDIGSTEIHQRGDANGDNSVTAADRSAIKYFLLNGGVIHPWMDCNSDGLITAADRSCIKYILTN